jgi:type IV pilus assembly protein PilA
LTSGFVREKIMPEKSSKSSANTNVIIGVAVGCGCLFLTLPVIGILAAIALPSFLNQANKAKQSEAKQYVGAIARSEQAYLLENKKFAMTLEELNKPVSATTVNYTYQIRPIPGTIPAVAIQANARKPALKSYIGIVAVEGNETSTAIICQSSVSQTTVLPPVKIVKGPLVCPPNTVPAP